ncbi:MULTISPECIES: 5'-methylthioadenosine/S-adenosylhomocysteine nucleosidase [unclassified Alteromonas]|uniref:5'-methylthioadenosine/S-adenosylhomocysteine nucleosidase n=1 Tax=unclassified Alteromonas TaxID=2614992 RepID=UPI00050939CD|nr:MULTISPECIES: 5'-methylthioadenosine/S-adenosylhomocysteine nucleosidase [unclassified Alteromonas]
MKKHIFVLLFTFSSLWLSGCTSTIDIDTSSTTAYGPKVFESPSFTAITVAYAPEMQGILNRIEQDPNASIHTTTNIKGITYRLGTYHDQPILVFATGMSIANAALSMQMALDYFPVKQVVFMGIAGAVNPKWRPGDVIVPARWYYHDESVYTNEDPSAPGEYILPEYYEAFVKEQDARRVNDPHLPHYKPFQFIHPDEVLIVKEGMDEPVDTAYFSATQRLLDAAQTAMSTMPTQRVLDDRDATLFVGGNGVTGSVFLDNREYRQWTRDVFSAEVTEMESAAIGQVCTINDVDWVIIRAISDLAGGQEGLNVESKYDTEVSRIGANVLFSVLDELSKGQ